MGYGGAISRIVACFGSGDLDVDDFMHAVQDRVNALYPVG
jgi:hypothetical protein